MKSIVCVFLSLMVFLPALCMESTDEEKLILIVEKSERRSIIPETVQDALEERLSKECGNEVSIKTLFDATCSTPKEAREKFPNSHLNIVLLGAGEGPINDTSPGQSFMAKNLSEIAIIGNNMLKDNLRLSYQCFQASLTKEAISSDNWDIFRCAGLFLVNPSNSDTAKDMDKIMVKLRAKLNKK